MKGKKKRKHKPGCAEGDEQRDPVDHNRQEEPIPLAEVDVADGAHEHPRKHKAEETGEAGALGRFLWSESGEFARFEKAGDGSLDLLSAMNTAVSFLIDFASAEFAVHNTTALRLFDSFLWSRCQYGRQKSKVTVRMRKDWPSRWRSEAPARALDAI